MSRERRQQTCSRNKGSDPAQRAPARCEGSRCTCGSARRARC
jgi:hypothetical protein